MYTKHFFKMVIGFTLIVGLGILGLFAINSYQKEQELENTIPAGTIPGQ